MGLVNMEVEFADPNFDGNSRDSFEYDMSREGNRISAVFASSVRGSVGKNRKEDQEEVGFSIYSPSAEKDIFNVMSNYPFGYFQDGSPNTKVLVEDFKQKGLKSNDLQSISFLSAVNLPDEADYVVGIVHPDGYAVNDEFQDDEVGFEVEQIDGSEFLVSFSGLTNPTFLAFPLWFPGIDKTNPPNFGSVVAGTEKCDSTGCNVHVGAGEDSLADYNLGFSFLALNGSLEADKVSGIVHGVVTLVNSANAPPTVTVAGSGFTATAHFSSPASTFEMFSGDKNLDEIEFEGYGGGVLIEFDNSFRGLPSVIVNPIFGDRTLDIDGEDEFSLPYAIVEHITENSALVKAYWLDTLQDEKKFEPISFHIVAVAPPRDPYLPIQQ